MCVEPKDVGDSSPLDYNVCKMCTGTILKLFPYIGYKFVFKTVK